MSAGQRIIVINTLGGALEHYTKELVHDLEQGGANCEVIAIDEPSKSGKSSRSWLNAYIKALRSAKKGGQPMVVTWPLLGYLDLVIMRLVAGRTASVIMHDPRPLVKARGYGRISQMVGVWMGARPLIVHSTQARQAIDNPRLRKAAVLVAHPMLQPVPKRAALEPAQVIRVLGQYKPDRNLDVLRDLAVRVSSTRLEIVGRRWPAVTGWSVKDEFVSEEEMADLIESSGVILVPYRRFFQSGIAVRCLEAGTPVVGPRGTSMDDLLGVESPLLAGGDWTPPILFALSEAGAEHAARAATKWYARAIADWRQWLAGQGGHR